MLVYEQFSELIKRTSGDDITSVFTSSLSFSTMPMFVFLKFNGKCNAKRMNQSESGMLISGIAHFPNFMLHRRLHTCKQVIVWIKTFV